jgi:thioredoxin reductase (NADPH)
MTDPVQTDVVIIGAGPVGLFAVFECGMVGLSTQVVDSLDHIGGQCAALYPEKPIYDIPARPVVLGQDLVSDLEKQAAPFKPGYHLGQQVMSVSKENGIWTVTTSTGTCIQSRAIIIAGGAGSFGPQKPPLEGLEDFEGTSVFYSVKAREQFRDKTIVIAGGGDSAVDWALSLSEIAKKVSVVHRRDKFRAAPASIGRLHALDAAGRLDLVVPYQLSALEGEDGKLSAVIVSDMSGKDRVIEADILLPFFGLASTLGPIADWGLTLERNQIVIDPTTGATGVDGIYAIGDMAAYPNKIKLILTGFAEAAQAAHAIYRYINPGRDLHFEYSTTSGVLGLAGSKS